MNREILFRAKRRDNGEWVEGYVIQRYGALQKSRRSVRYCLRIWILTPQHLEQCA